MGKTPDQTSCYWARASYSREFLGRNEVNVAGDLARSETRQGTFSIALGTNLRLGQNFSLQAEAVQLFGSEKGIQANLAVNYVW